MVVRCPHCQSGYRLDPARVPAHAVRVRCPRCAQVFRVTANASGAPPPAAPSADALGIEREAWRPPIGRAPTPLAKNPAPASAPAAAPSRPAWTAEGERTLDLGGQAPKGPAPRLETAPFRPGATPMAPPPTAPPTDVAPPPARVEPPRRLEPAPPGPAPTPFQPAAPRLPRVAAAAPRPAPAPPAWSGPAPSFRPSVAAPSLPPPPAPAPPSGAAHDRARRLARVLVSDILVYNEAARDRARQEGTLATTLATEIRKAWDLYATKIGSEVATTTPYFKDALNEILAGGEAIF